MGVVRKAILCIVGVGLIAAACTGSADTGPSPSTWFMHHAEWEAGAVVTAEDVTDFAAGLSDAEATVLLPPVVPRQTTMSLALLEHTRPRQWFEARLELSGPPELLLASKEPDFIPQECSDTVPADGGWQTVDIRGIPGCHRMVGGQIHVHWSENNRYLSVETGVPLEQLRDELTDWIWLSGDERTVGNFPPEDTTVITGDIGSIAYTSNWPLGAEPGDAEVALLTGELATARVPLLVPLGTSRPDRAVSVEISKFIIHPDGAIVRVSDEAGRPVLSLRTLPLDDFWSRACPFLPEPGTKWGPIRIRGTTGCHTRAKGEITRIEWSEANRAVIVNVTNADDVPDWLEEWVWLPSQGS